MALSTIPKDSIATDAIDGTKIADDAINSEHYTDGSIDTAHIADSQVTAAKTSGVAGTGLKRLHKLTMSSSSTASFAAGDNSGAVLFDGTYKYLLWVWTLNVSADNHVQFQWSTDGGSSYGVNIACSSWVSAEHVGGTGSGHTFDSSSGTDGDTQSGASGFQNMTWYQTAESGYQFHGTMELWNPQASYPSWNARAYYTSSGARIVNTQTHGWCNESDIDGFRIQPAAGNFASGEISMYGLLRA